MLTALANCMIELGGTLEGCPGQCRNRSRDSEPVGGLVPSGSALVSVRGMRGVDGISLPYGTPLSKQI